MTSPTPNPPSPAPDGRTADAGARLENRLLTAAWTAVALLVAACAVRWLRLDDRAPTVVVVTFLPWLLLPSYAVLGVAFGARRFALAAIALVVIACHVTWVADDLAWRRADTAMGPGAEPFELVAANVFFGNDDIDAAFDDVLSDAGDIVVLSEMRGAWWDRLQSHPIADVYPNRFRNGDVAILSLTPILQRGVVPGTDMPWVELAIGDTELTVVGVHAVPATQTARWTTDLAGLEAFARARIGPLVLAGDFNATAQHRQLRDIIDLGFIDAHKQQGSGWGATWPTDFVLGPMLRLDRVLVTPGSLRVTAYTDRQTSGSDHRRVISGLQITTEPA